MQVSNLSYHAPLGKSDHCVLTFEFEGYIDYTKPKARFLYNKTDYNAAGQYLKDINWKEKFYSSIDQTTSIEEMWTKLKYQLTLVRNTYVPLSNNYTHDWKSKGNTPINKNIQLAIRRKQISHRQWINRRGDKEAEIARLAFKRAMNKVKSLIKKAKRTFERDIASKAK